MADAMWDGTEPDANDGPPNFEGDYNSNMAKFCVPRHSRMINMLFMDKSVRKVGLKKLWYLPWNREWVEKLQDWPAWMKDLPAGS
jgi:hypothetical protein